MEDIDRIEGKLSKNDSLSGCFLAIWSMFIWQNRSDERIGVKNPRLLSRARDLAALSFEKTIFCSRFFFFSPGNHVVLFMRNFIIHSVWASMVDASSADHSSSHTGKTASYYFCYFPIKTAGKHQRRNDLIRNVAGLCTTVCILQITLC